MLYFVATPIGNLGDISLRAIETLKSVDLIACEDTRHSATLLNHLQIKKPLISYHKFNEKESGEKIIAELNNGKNVAVISDAGMPVISDPGSVLVNMLIENGIKYTVVPGASAFTSALLLSGFDASKFCFLGFLPEKQSERETLLKNYKNTEATLIFYSAPHDVKKDVESLYMGLGSRRACAVREITKMYETVDIFNLEEGYKKDVRGEYVLIVEGAKPFEEEKNLSAEELINKFMGEGLDKKEALKKTAKIKNLPKSELYKYTIGK